MSPHSRKALSVGDRISVTIEKIAHGGHFIARHEGAVIFVRHAIPDEVCTIEITSVGTSFNRADVISVESTSSDRVSAPCRYAHRQGCGGCDFQHIRPARQRELKSDVITEQFARIAKMEIDIEVEEVSAPLHWRTRYAATTDAQSRIGFKSLGSNRVIPIDSCPILVPEIDLATLPHDRLKASSRVEVAISTQGERVIGISDSRNSRQDKNPPVSIIEGTSPLRYDVSSAEGNFQYQVSSDSFWQGNINAPAALVDAVMEYAQVEEGDHLLDLYGGVGLFAGAAIETLGPTGRIDIVEGARSATSDARANFEKFKNVHIHTGDVAKEAKKFDSADVILLDPPRTGAGAGVIESITQLGARAIVYIACDPAALARDTGYLRDAGYHLEAIRAFDIFPMTHHVESVALYTPSEVS